MNHKTIQSIVYSHIQYDSCQDGFIDFKDNVCVELIMGYYFINGWWGVGLVIITIIYYFPKEFLPTCF